jgi:hypothetical protein
MFLGINITNKLKWNIHIQSVCKKLSKMCYIIKALKDKGSPHILRNVYFAKFQHMMKGVTKRTSCRDIFR